MHKKNFEGKWRIIDMDQWEPDYIDELEPGYIQFGQDGSGSLHFGYIFADIDYRITENLTGNIIEFSFAGKDERDEVCGRGTAIQVSNQLSGHIYIHHGDESAFTAKSFTYI